jgi:hypothetical protein
MDSLAVKSVSIAVPSDSSNVDASTIRSLTFEKKNNFKIAPGSDIYSDELNFNLKSNSLLAITISYAKVTQSVTGHPVQEQPLLLLKVSKAMLRYLKIL